MSEFAGDINGADVASRTYPNTINIAARNSIFKFVKGTGLAVLDGAKTREDRLRMVQGFKGFSRQMDTKSGRVLRL